jgi:tRNA threonylcarbamoyladenosine modification (KEOPS) complex  Pcc1 subunit
MVETQRRCDFSLSIKGDTRLIELLYKSLAAETDDYPADRSRVDIDANLDEGCLQLDITSGNIVSLRANINTWLRLIKVVDDISKIF